MARNNNDTFIVHGYYAMSAFDGYLIQVSDDGSMARVAYSYTSSEGEVRKVSRWQEIKFTLKSNSPYVIHHGRRLHLDYFTRPL